MSLLKNTMAHYLNSCREEKVGVVSVDSDEDY